MTNIRYAQNQLTKQPTNQTTNQTCFQNCWMPLARQWQCIGLRPAAQQQQGTAADSREDQSAAAQNDQGTFPITDS